MKRMIAALIVLGTIISMSGVSAAQPTTESCGFDNGHHAMDLELPTQAMDDVKENNPHVSCEPECDPNAVGCGVDDPNR